MEFENIKELIKLFDESSISKLKISRDDFSIDLEKRGAEVTYVATPTPLVQAPTATQVVDISAPVETSHTVSAPTAKGEIITSPMVGTFYKAPSPDSAPYAKAGEIVRKGQPLAIIEAMKIMNEIEADFDCRVLEILVEDGQPVEYDMPLFRVEKA